MAICAYIYIRDSNYIICKQTKVLFLLAVENFSVVHNNNNYVLVLLIPVQAVKLQCPKFTRSPMDLLWASATTSLHKHETFYSRGFTQHKML